MDRAMAPLLLAVDWVYVCTYQSLLCVLDCVMDFSAASGHCRVQRLSVRLLRWLDLLAGIRSSEDRLAPPPHRAVTAARALYVKIPQCYGECLRFTGVSKGEETMQILTLPWHCPLPSLRWQPLRHPIWWWWPAHALPLR